VIRSAAIVAALTLLGAPAASAEPPNPVEDPPAPDDPLSPYRTPFPVLAERAIGTASKPVEFDWRRTDVHVAVRGEQLFELNNFNSLRAGAMARIPGGGLVYELGLTYVWVWDTPSSEQLALTPYRQPGRPSRMEFDFTLGLPVAEGVVTWFPRFFPTAQMVFNGYVGLRYAIYPQGYAHLTPSQVVGAIFSPKLSEQEIENLEDHRLDSMEVDPGRYWTMVGFGTDLYVRNGMFVSPRMMFSLPILAPVSETQLLFSAEVSLAIGVAF
jgi:hypothetical protein